MADIVPSRSQAFLWNHISRIVDYGITYLLSIILARILAPEDYGVYVALFSFGATMIIVANFGIDESLNRFIAPLNTESRKSSVKFLFLLRMAFLSFICLLIVLFSSQIKHFLGISNGTLILGVIVVYIFSQSMTNFYINYHTAEMRTKSIFFINVTVKLLVLASIPAVLAFSTEVIYPLSVIAFFSLVSFLVYLFINKDVFGTPFDSRASKSIINFSAVLWFNALLTMILGRYSDILLINYFVEETKWASYYDIAFSICIILEYIFTIGFMGVGLSMLSKAASESKQALNNLRLKLIKYHQLSVLPAGVFLFIFANEIVPLVFSAKYNEAIPLLRIYLVFTIIVVSFLGSGTNVGALSAIGKQKLTLITRLVIGVSNLVLKIFIVKEYGALGVIWVTGIAYLLTYSVDFILASKYIGFSYDFIFLIKTILISAIAAGVTYAITAGFDLNAVFGGIIMAFIVLSGYFIIKLDNDLNGRAMSIAIKLFNLKNRSGKWEK